MDAMPITEHANPLKKLREVLMTCGRHRSAVETSSGVRNAFHRKQYFAWSLVLQTIKL